MAGQEQHEYVVIREPRRGCCLVLELHAVDPTFNDEAGAPLVHHVPAAVDAIRPFDVLVSQRTRTQHPLICWNRAGGAPVLVKDAYPSLQYVWLRPASTLPHADDGPGTRVLTLTIPEGSAGKSKRLIRDQLAAQADNALFADFAGNWHRDLGARDPTLTAPVLDTLPLESGELATPYFTSLWTSECRQATFASTWMAWRCANTLNAPGSRPYCRFMTWRPVMWNRLPLNPGADRAIRNRNAVEGVGEVDMRVFGCAQGEPVAGLPPNLPPPADGTASAELAFDNITSAGALGEQATHALAGANRDLVLSARLHDLVMNYLRDDHDADWARAGQRQPPSTRDPELVAPCKRPTEDVRRCTTFRGAGPLATDNRMQRFPTRREVNDDARYVRTAEGLVAALLARTATRPAHESPLLVDLSVADMASLVHVAAQLVPLDAIIAGE